MLSKSISLQSLKIYLHLLHILYLPLSVLYNCQFSPPRILHPEKYLLEAIQISSLLNLSLGRCKPPNPPPLLPQFNSLENSATYSVSGIILPIFPSLFFFFNFLSSLFNANSPRKPGKNKIKNRKNFL